MIISVENVSKSIDNKKIIDNISFKIDKGEMLAILGPNGAGKTTITRLIQGLLTVDSGKITINNMPLNNDSSYKFRENIGIQNDGNLYEELSIAENIKVWLKLYQKYNAYYLSEFEKLIDIFNLRKYINYKVNQLSKGNKQKASIVRALCTKPDLLILDEPTSGLDPEATNILNNYLLTLKKSGVSIILCTHLLYGLENSADKLLIINDGKSLLYGYTNQLMNNLLSKQEFIFEISNDKENLTNLLTESSINFKIKENSIGNIFIHTCINKDQSLNFILNLLIKNDIEIYDVQRKKINIKDLYFLTIEGEG